MANVNAINTANLLAFAAEYATEIIEKALMELEVNKHFMIDTKISNGKRYPKMSISDVLGPYTGSKATTGNEINLYDRELRVDVGQAVISIDPENLRRTFMGKVSKITNGAVPNEEKFLSYFIQKVFDQFNMETFWKGDKTLADTAPNKSKRMMDGLEKDLLAAITATEIVPVTTAALSGGTGWNATFTDGNVIQATESVWENLASPYRKNASKIFVSEPTFKKLVNQHNGRSMQLDYLDNSKDSFALEGTGGKGIVTKAHWLQNSSRIIAANDGAIIVGTDTASMVSDLDIQKDGFMWIYLTKIIAGVRIIDTDAVSCNNLV